MKLHSTSKNVETNMTGATSFTIKASAKAFKILSDGLYSDKIRAVIRELSCNALDSHKSANKSDTPITVHLPNTFEPFFSVKDEGLGLSKENVLKLYTTYFESTKAEDDEQIGALGLGSKSPFSYTDAFTVISVYEGVKSTYSAYIGPNGEPSILHLADMNTDEINGVEVQFAVKRDDFDTFSSKASVVYRPFNVKPNILGKNTFTIQDRGNVLYSGNGWSFYSSPRYYSDRIAFAIQGNIEYPLDKNTISPDNDKQLFVLSQNIDIEFNLGELDISASRESLGYDAITIANIKARAEQVYDELMEVLSKQVEDSDNMWDASIKMNDIISSFYESKLISSGLTYKGEDIPKSFKVEQNREVVYYWVNYRSATRVGRSKYKGSIEPKKDIKFYVNDLNSHMKSVTRVRNEVSCGTANKAILLEKHEVSLYGNPSYTLTSTLPDPKANREKGIKSAGKNFKMYSHYQNSKWQFDASFDDLKSVKYTDPGDIVYYVPVSGKQVSTHRDMYTMVEVGIYIGAIKHSSNVIGVKESYIGTKGWKELNESVTMVNFEEYLTKEVSKLKGNYMIESIINNSYMYSRYSNGLNSKVQAVIDTVKEAMNAVVGGIIKDTVVYLQDQKLYASAPQMSNTVIEFFKREVTLDSNHIDIDRDILQRYPMFAMVDHWALRDDNNKDVIINYINMIESM
jgi:hypothetical protein